MASIDRVMLGVDVLNFVLPQGVPRNSFIILAGEGGSGKSVLVISIAKHFLQQEEPVIYLALDDDPLTIVYQFQSFGINIDNYVNKKLFMIIDCFSSRIRGKKEPLHTSVIEEVDPQNIDSVLYTTIRVLDEYSITRRGIVIVDSLNEFLSYHDPLKVVELIKGLRANIAKMRNVLTLAILHTSTDDLKQFLLTIEHVVDGVILTETVVQHPAVGEIPIALRQLLVKKMKGVSHRVNWTLFTIDREGVKPVMIRIAETG